MILGILAAIAGGWFVLTTHTTWQKYRETKKSTVRDAMIVQAVLALALIAFALYRFIA